MQGKFTWLPFSQADKNILQLGSEFTPTPQPTVPTGDSPQNEAAKMQEDLRELVEDADYDAKKAGNSSNSKVPRH